MPQYTVTAFNYTQNGGWGTQYNTSFSATLDDDDATYMGQGDANESVSINGGAFGTTDSIPYIINSTFTDSSGGSHAEDFYFFQTGGNWYFIPAPGSAFTVGATMGPGGGANSTTGWNYSAVTCFTQGTLIETDRGPILVEDLIVGNLVRTRDAGEQPVRSILKRELTQQEIEDNPKLRPIRITAGALGKGLPERDLCVSRQHRMLVHSKIADRMFGAPDALVAAIRLTELPSIFVEPIAAQVTYYHLLFDSHEVIYAEGAPTESFYSGAEALKTLPLAARDEFLQLFPMQGLPHSACFIPAIKQQRQLVARHMKNNKILLECFP